MTEISRQFTSRQRKDATDKGHAMDDGSFPIKTVTDLRNAIAAIGRAKNPAAAKRHIAKRARELNAMFLLPKFWEKAAEAGDAERRARIAAAVTVPPSIERHNFLGDADNRCLTCKQIQQHPVHGIIDDPGVAKQILDAQGNALPVTGNRPASTTAAEDDTDDPKDADAAGRLAQGIDAGVDGALTLLRSTPDLPPYAAQAQALLQGIEPACDELLEFFGVPDADDQAGEDDDAATQQRLAQRASSRFHVSEHTQPLMNAPEAVTAKAFLTQAGGRTLITAPVNVFTSEWEKALTPNEHMLWLQGRFVGAEKANRNGAFWSTADLEMGEPTVKHGPLNWLHEAKHVIGTIADAKLVLPGETAAEGQTGEPHIMAMAAVWKWIYPSEAFVIEEASDQNKLWYSMECVSREVSCAGESGCGKSFPYMDVVKASAGVCEHIKGRTSTRHFVDPTFLGGAVIVPPVRPGWAEADARVLREAAAIAETSYEAACPTNMTATEWERLMAEVVGYALR